MSKIEPPFTVLRPSDVDEERLIMYPQRVESLSHTQRERLAYIDFRLYFMGEIGRPDLALYREIVPQNIEFDGSNKTYRIGKTFSPIFEYATQRVLSALALGFGDGVKVESQPLLPCAGTFGRLTASPVGSATSSLPVSKHRFWSKRNPRPTSARITTSSGLGSWSWA